MADYSYKSNDDRLYGDLISKNVGAIHKIGANHMVDRNDLFEPQRNNNFEIQLHLDGVRSPNGTPLIETPGSDHYPGQSIMLSVATFDAPTINIGVIEVPYGNNQIKYAGKPSYENSRVVVNDFIGLDIERILSNWHDCVFDPDSQKIGRAANYKASAHLVEYSPDGELYRMWMLHGVWPGTLNLGSFDQQGGSVRQVTLDLIYDYATIVTDSGTRKIK